MGASLSAGGEDRYRAVIFEKPGGVSSCAMAVVWA